MDYGYLLRYVERMRYRASRGGIRVEISVSTPINHNQIVAYRKVPAEFKISADGGRMVFRGMLSKRGIFRLDREFAVCPAPWSLKDTHFGSVDDYPADVVEKYKVGTRQWPIDSDLLRTVGSEAWFSEKDIRKWIENAFAFLWNSIKPERLNERLGAVKALSSGMGDCDEFTDVFVTLARMRGIPARRLTGIYFSENPENHAWAEVLLPSGIWITADAALRILGRAAPEYITFKIEEFNDEIPDLQVRWKGGALEYEIEGGESEVERIKCFQ